MGAINVGRDTAEAPYRRRRTDRRAEDRAAPVRERRLPAGFDPRVYDLQARAMAEMAGNLGRARTGNGRGPIHVSTRVIETLQEHGEAVPADPFRAYQRYFQIRAAQMGLVRPMERPRGQTHEAAAREVRDAFLRASAERTKALTREGTGGGVDGKKVRKVIGEIAEVIDMVGQNSRHQHQKQSATTQMQDAQRQAARRGVQLSL
jgi:hypothetical protein